jgi:hypothetical protein
MKAGLRSLLETLGPTWIKIVCPYLSWFCRLRRENPLSFPFFSSLRSPINLSLPLAMTQRSSSPCLPPSPPSAVFASRKEALPSSSPHAIANLKISPRRMPDQNFYRSFNKIYLAIQYNQFGNSVNYHKNYPTAHKSKLL